MISQYVPIFFREFSIPVQMRLNETQAQPRLWIRQLTFKGCIAGLDKLFGTFALQFP